MFRVAPLRFVHVLLGKSIAYILFVTVAGVILTGLLSLLKVPMPAAYPWQHLGLIVLLATASVGVGLLISSLSRTDSQAVQFTMLLLLLSIFFTGFFLPLTGFARPARIVANLLPMTHALAGFRGLLLGGQRCFIRTLVGAADHLSTGLWVGLADHAAPIPQDQLIEDPRAFSIKTF
jgi:ABC-2 type transport system permease protein